MFAYLKYTQIRHKKNKKAANFHYSKVQLWARKPPGSPKLAVKGIKIMQYKQSYRPRMCETISRVIEFFNAFKTFTMGSTLKITSRKIHLLHREFNSLS